MCELWRPLKENGFLVGLGWFFFHYVIPVHRNGNGAEGQIHHAWLAKAVSVDEAYILQKTWELLASCGDNFGHPGVRDKYDEFEMKSPICSVIQHFIKMIVIIAWPVKSQKFSFWGDQQMEN